MNALVSEFATALDQEDYRAAGECLSKDCIYDSPKGKVVGPEAILVSYQSNGDSARDRFDSIVYSHSIRQMKSDWFEIEPGICP